MQVEQITRKFQEVERVVSSISTKRGDKQQESDSRNNKKKDRKIRFVDWCVFQWVRAGFAFLSLSLPPFFVYPLSPPFVPLPLPLFFLYFTNQAPEKRVSFNRESFTDKTWCLVLLFGEILFVRLCRTRLFVPAGTTLYLHGRPGWINFCFWFSVLVYDGDQLNLTRISRNEMGAYLCIATNGVPPTVSKRITVDVECEWVSRIYTYIYI